MPWHWQRGRAYEACQSSSSKPFSRHLPIGPLFWFPRIVSSQYLGASTQSINPSVKVNKYANCSDYRPFFRSASCGPAAVMIRTVSNSCPQKDLPMWHRIVIWNSLFPPMSIEDPMFLMAPPCSWLCRMIPCRLWLFSQSYSWRWRTNSPSRSSCLISWDKDNVLSLYRDSVQFSKSYI